MVLFEIRIAHYVHFTVTIKKAHFWLNGYVNKQNCRIWSDDNPQVYVETPLHPEKLTVWSGAAVPSGSIVELVRAMRGIVSAGRRKSRAESSAPAIGARASRPPDGAKGLPSPHACLAE